MSEITTMRQKLQSHYMEKRVFGKDETSKMLYSVLPVMVEELEKRREGKSTDLGIGKYESNTLHKTAEKVFGVSFSELMYDLGIRTDKHSIGDIIKMSGHDSNRFSLIDAVKERWAYGTVLRRDSIPTDYRFLIPEIILATIMTSYEERAHWQKWVSGTDPVSQITGIVVPRVERGESMPYEIGEGQTIPMGSVQFGQKNTKVKKYGIGFGLTYEMAMTQAIDTLAAFMRMSTSDTNIAENSAALFCLLNGEQADGSESAAVIGVDATADGFKAKDINRVTTQLSGLNFNANTCIASNDNALQDLNQSFPNRDELIMADKFPAGMVNLYDLPDPDQILIFDSNAAMRRMQFGSFKLETERDIFTQKESIVMSFYSGFYAQLRSAKCVIDKSVTYSTTPFPAHMNYQSRRQEAFKSGF